MRLGGRKVKCQVEFNNLRFLARICLLGALGVSVADMGLQSSDIVASALAAADETQTSEYWFAKERAIQIELLDLAQRQQPWKLTAQLYASRAKQQYKEE